jgi:hypothetical protein
MPNRRNFWKTAAGTGRSCGRECGANDRWDAAIVYSAPLLFPLPAGLAADFFNNNPAKGAILGGNVGKLGADPFREEWLIGRLD